MWLMKVKESQQFQFFASYAIDIFMLMNFNPLIKLLLLVWDLIVSVPDHCLSFYFLFVTQGEDLSFFSFVKGTNLFSVSKFTCSPKKDSEKLKNSHFGQIHVQFLFFSFILSKKISNDQELIQSDPTSCNE